MSEVRPSGLELLVGREASVPSRAVGVAVPQEVAGRARQSSRPEGRTSRRVPSAAGSAYARRVMDPWAPIQGITLERYAELSAEIEGTQDPERQAEIVARLGVTRPDWEAAKAGWTARMQDMSLMGQVATRFMPLYQAALAKKSPAPQVSFEDYVAMSGAAAAIGYEPMLAHYRVTPGQWTQIGGHWNAQIPTNPRFMQYGLLVEQEAARIRAGGPPRPVTLGAPQPPQAHPQAHPPPHPYAAANPFGSPHQQAAFNQQANQLGNDIGNAFASFGNAVESLWTSAAMTVGSRVLVQWSDGQRYPGTVTMIANGQVQVAFPNGQQVWVAQHFVTLT